MNSIVASLAASLLFFGLVSNLYAVRLDRTMPNEPYGRNAVSWQYNAISVGLIVAAGISAAAALWLW